MSYGQHTSGGVVLVIALSIATFSLCEAKPVTAVNCNCKFDVGSDGVLVRGNVGAGVCDPKKCSGALVLTGNGQGSTSSALENVVIKSLDKDVFKDLTNVESIDMSYNQLNQLPADVFSTMTALKTLKLSFNQLTTLPEKVFTKNVQLQTLNLDHNLLGQGSLPDLVFEANYNLRILDLKHNQIPSLPLGVFQNMIDNSLLKNQRIDVSENQLQCYPPLSAESMSSGAMDRYIRDTGVEACRGFVKCQTIDADKEYACMWHIDASGYLSRGKDYNSKECKPEKCLSSLDFSNLVGAPKITKFTYGAFKGLSNIEYLYFGAQEVGGNMPPAPFRDMFKIRHLDLAGTWGTNGGNVPEQLLYGLSDLMWLDMRNNQLAVLPANFFSHSVQLQTLILMGNKLTTMSEGWLDHNKNLIEIFISDNQLTSLPTSSFDNNPKLAVSIENNDNLNCIPVSVGGKMIDKERLPSSPPKDFCNNPVANRR